MKLIRRLQYNSPVVLTFALCSLLALFLDRMTLGWTNAHFFSMYHSSLWDPLTYFRMFGHVLGHSSWEHYSGNIILLLVIGPQLEEKYGSRWILISVIITAFVTGLAQWVLFPNTAVLGASGIVFMMILMASMGGMKSGQVPLTLILVGIFYIGGEIFRAAAGADNISQFSHILGGICGAVLGYCAGKTKR